MVEYNLDYYEKHLREYSKSAEYICRIRWGWISGLNPKRVLDYGCDVGWFRAFRPEGIEVDSFDIGAGPNTGIRVVLYDVVCFWDVLEHIPNYKEVEPVFRLANAIAGTIPVKPDGIEWNVWKHWKPGEHYHYFTKDILLALFNKYGFVMEKVGYPECPPRSDVMSFLFRREKP